MNQNVRVRFAPSPTGPLHIGGLRTALYNYLFAKKYQGSFILRIEDTDQARLIPQSESYIIEALAWLGLIPDESTQQGGTSGPYTQSARKHIYQQYALQLLQAGKAYYAFDTPEELTAMREKSKAIGQKAPQYNAINRMQMKNSLTLSPEEVQRRIHAGQPYVIRMLIDPKLTIKTKDTIRGWIQVQGSSLDDKILLKADGMATYHLANVVDDYLMHITHVIRGEEWLPSLPYHVLLYNQLAWEKPAFVHLPLLLNADGKGKLSKRNTIQQDLPILPLSWEDPTTGHQLPGFREKGYLPQALLNFIALLGWHPSTNQELFTLQELIEHFTLARISKSSACVDIQKAQWFNQKHLQRIPDQQLARQYLVPILTKQNIRCTLGYATKICNLVKKGITFPEELVTKSQYFFFAPAKKLIQESPHWNQTTKAFLATLLKKLSNLNDFYTHTLEELIQTHINHHTLKKGVAMQIIRLTVIGHRVGPPLAELLATVGKEKVIQRIQNLL